jgi:hypothetical protein
MIPKRLWWCEWSQLAGERETLTDPRRGCPVRNHTEQAMPVCVECDCRPPELRVTVAKKRGKK